MTPVLVWYLADVDAASVTPAFADAAPVTPVSVWYLADVASETPDSL